MVNRVFCYSKEVAKKNGNTLPVLQLILATIIFMVAILVMTIFVAEALTLFILLIFLFMVAIIYLAIRFDHIMKTRMSGWATTNDGKVYKAMTVNNGQGLFVGGVAVGSLVDQMVGKGSGIGGDIGGTVGTIAQYYSMHKSAEYMSHPEIVAKMVEEAPNVTGAEVYEILKVHSITQKHHFVKINCDYKIVRTGKVKYNKKMKIEKSFNQMTDLIDVLNTHKG